MQAVWSYIDDLDHKRIFTFTTVLIGACLVGAIALDMLLLALIPLTVIVIGLAISDFRILYVLFLLALPFSIEIYLPSGLGTDLPTEPLMIAITVVGSLLYFQRATRADYRYLFHPVSVLMIAHLVWIAISSIGAQNPVFSFKYLLAKLWYVVPFFFLPFMMIRNARDTRRAIYLLLIPLMIAVLFILYRHAGYGFSFKTSNEVVYPIFRNHVNYAALLVMFLPFVVGLRILDYSNKRIKYTLTTCIIILVVAIYFSYTRAAQGSIVIALLAYYIIKLRLIRPAIAVAMIVLIIGSIWLVHNNNYLKFAPNYQSTVSHFKFDNLIEATYKLEDISTMERVHRWVAGGRMIADKPIAGFGPANFYSEYRDYALTEFKTYVSNNPEKSGIHNYYLMIAVEQGVVGLLIFLALLIVALSRGEDLYHRLKGKKRKALVMSAMICIIISAAILLINDMLEADKVGPLFFFSLSVIVIYDILDRKKTTKRQQEAS